MFFLRTGHFFGQTNRKIHLNGITLNDKEFTPEHIDWHCHENAFFTFILQGEIIEANKNKHYHCSPGSLLFHSWQEPHYNVQSDSFMRCLLIEFDKNCFDDYAFDINALQGSFSIENPDIKFLLYKVFRETRIDDDVAATSIRMLLFKALGQMLRFEQIEKNTKPLWAKKLKEILRDSYAEKLSLRNLSNELNIHPVHLSRGFPKYFRCTFGEYVRKIRVEKSLSLLPNKNLSLTEIAFNCGFADQSHFLRCFKQINGITPSDYRKLLVG